MIRRTLQGGLVAAVAMFALVPTVAVAAEGDHADPASVVATVPHRPHTLLPVPARHTPVRHHAHRFTRHHHHYVKHHLPGWQIDPVYGTDSVHLVAQGRRYDALVLSGFEDTMDHSERLFRAWVARLPDGVYEFEDFGDRDIGRPEEPMIRVHGRLTIEENQATVDSSDATEAAEATSPVADEPEDPDAAEDTAELPVAADSADAGDDTTTDQPRVAKLSAVRSDTEPDATPPPDGDSGNRAKEEEEKEKERADTGTEGSPSG